MRLLDDELREPYSEEVQLVEQQVWHWWLCDR